MKQVGLSPHEEATKLSIWADNMERHLERATWFSPNQRMARQGEIARIRDRAKQLANAN